MDSFDVFDATKKETHSYTFKKQENIFFKERKRPLLIIGIGRNVHKISYLS